MLTTAYVQRMLPRTHRYGQALAHQADVLETLFRRATMDMTETLGPTLLLAQAVARAMDTVVALWLSDPSYPTLPLRWQEDLGVHATRWGDLRTALENLAIQRRMPAIGALERTTASSRAFGAVARGVALGTKLEEILFPADHVITFEKFWALQAPSLAAVGRLVTADPVLSTTLDISLETEVLALLDGCVPLVPDVTTLLADIEAARPPGLRTSGPAQAQVWQVKDGDTLETVAQMVLGDPDFWRFIAAYNVLRYPYISNDPTVQYGDLITEKNVATMTVLGSTTLALTTIFALAPEQRLYLKGVNGTQLVTIRSIDDVAKTCEITPALTVVLLTDDLVQVFPPAYEVPSRVLVTGDTVLVPLPVLDRPQGPIRPSGTGTSAEHVYGIDVDTTEQGRLRIDIGGDLILARGAPNLVQALRHRLTTPRGSVLHHPNYGFGLINYLGSRHTAFLGFLARVESSQAALGDPRVDHIEDFTAEGMGDTMQVTFTTVTTIEDRFPVTATTPMRVTP